MFSLPSKLQRREKGNDMIEEGIAFTYLRIKICDVIYLPKF